MTVFTIDNSDPNRDVIKNLVNSIVLAFSSDPIVRWMYPNQEQYQKHFPNFVKTFASRAFDHNTVYCTPDYAGGAFWFLPQIEPDTDAVIELIQQTVSEAIQEDVFTLFEQTSHFHPQQSYWYLGILGIKPSQQNKGYGSALIKQVLAHCDRHSQLAYLESSNPANLPFYQRHGFEIMGKIQAGSSPTMFPMVRYPPQATIVV